MKEVYKKLIAPLPQEAIEHAPKSVTRKGYDTTGYQYQYLVERLNEVLGLGGWSFSFKVIKEEQGVWASGKKYWEITTEVTVELKDIQKYTCVGGHKSEAYADALKGAITNGFKKTIAFSGLGGEAYKGTIDEDYQSSTSEDIGNGEREKNKADGHPPIHESTQPPSPLQPISADELLQKIKNSTALPHLKNIWTKYYGYEGKNFTQAERDILVEWKDKCKEELTKHLKGGE